MGKDKKKNEGPHCPCSIETDLYEEWKKINKPKDKLEASKKKKSEDDKETSSKNIVRIKKQPNNKLKQ